MDRKCYLMDIDGTLADATHRLHHIKGEVKDWDTFFDKCVDDPPIEHMVTLCRILARYHTVVFVSGRSSRVWKQTLEWLRRHGCITDDQPYNDRLTLYMRQEGDHRPDDVVKGELLERIMHDGYKPLMAFDDRQRVVDMWRRLGIPCAQVAEGDF